VRNELRDEEGEKGRECTSAMHNRADAPVWGSSSDEGRRARSTHLPGPSVCKESTHWRKRSFPAHAAQRAHSCHNEEEGREASYPALYIGPLRRQTEKRKFWSHTQIAQ